MTVGRFVSMYYASIGKRRAFVAIGDWISGALVPADRRRGKLAAAVRGYLGKGDVFALGSGRSALAACLKAAGIGAGDEVVLSSYTCLAVPTGVIAAGATPVYVDVNPSSLNADADAVIAAITPRTKAIVVQHTLGAIAEVQAIADAARPRGVLVIEDCALAAGSRARGRHAGTVADAAIFSMELSKTISCGWGGVLVVHDARLADAMRALYATLPEPSRVRAARDLWQTAISAWCHQPALFHVIGKYVLFLGFRSGIFRRSTPHAEYDGRVEADFLQKMAGAQAALAARQWRALPAIGERCAQHARTLRHALAELGFDAPGSPREGDECVAPRVSFLAADRAAIMAYFFARGLELGEWFDGPLSPPPTSPLFNYDAARYPRAAGIARHVVNLPCHNRLSSADITRLCETLRDFARESPGCTTHTVYEPLPV